MMCKPKSILKIFLPFMVLSSCFFTACRQKSAFKGHLEYFQEWEDVREEISVKMNRIQQFLKKEELEGVLLSRVDNIAWITAGLCRAYDTPNTEFALASLLILKDGRKYVICAENHVKRLMDENLKLLEYEAKTFSWQEARAERSMITRMAKDIIPAERIGGDVAYSGFIFVDEDINRLKKALTPQEIERYRWLGRQTAEAVTEICRQVQPGMDEYRIEYLMARELLSRGVTPAQLSISMDERILAYGRTLPGGATLKKMAMIGVTGKKWGISVALTRLLHLGPPYRDVEERIRKTIEMSARFQETTRPGKSIHEILEESKAWFATSGYPDEWQKYPPYNLFKSNYRMYDECPEKENVISDNQLISWHPTIKGVTIEDTYIIYKKSIEIVTYDDRWPMIPIELNGKIYQQPDVMIR